MYSRTEILVLIDDEVFLSHVFGLLVEMKSKQIDFLVVIPELLLKTHLYLFDGFNLLKHVRSMELITANLMISQWGSPRKRPNQKNWLMHTGLFNAAKNIMVPHGLEIKCQELRIPLVKKLFFIRPPYCEYQNISYFFDTEFHFSRYRNIKYFEKLILKNPTFHSIHTPKIKECVQLNNVKLLRPIIFLPKVLHIGQKNFQNILYDAASDNITIRVHPREELLQKSLISNLGLNLEIINNFRPIDLFNVNYLYDYGTSIAALARLIKIEHSLKNLSNKDLIFDWSGWSKFEQSPEDFGILNELIK